MIVEEHPQPRGWPKSCMRQPPSQVRPLGRKRALPRAWRREGEGRWACAGGLKEERDMAVPGVGVEDGTEPCPERLKWEKLGCGRRV